MCTANMYVKEESQTDEAQSSFPTPTPNHQFKVSQSVTGKFFQCNNCDKTYIFVFEPNDCIHSPNGETIYPCPNCKTPLSRSSNPEKAAQPMTYKCYKCMRTLVGLTSLSLHLQIHVVNELHACERCGEKFIYRTHLIEHLRAAHSVKKPFRCDMCGKCYAKHESLKAHIAVRYGGRRHKCPICAKSYTHKYTLTRHMKNHKSFFVHQVPSSLVKNDSQPGDRSEDQPGCSRS